MAAAKTQATNTIETTPESEIQGRIETLRTNLKDYIDTQKVVMKEMVTTLGQIEKLFAKTVRQKSKRRRQTTPQRYSLDSKVAKSLSKLGLSGNVFTRSEVMKGVSAYIREHNLQNKENKSVWFADATISKVLSVAKGSENSYLQINKLITPLFKTATKVAPEEASGSA